MSNIIIDSAEKPYVFRAFDKLDIDYIKESILVPEPCDKIPIRDEEGNLTCVGEADLKIFDEMEVKYEKDDLACNECPKNPVHVGDFTNENRSFIAERKRVDDFYASMADGRLYDQGRKMYSYCKGLKILILEGMAGFEYFNDAFNPFEEYDMSMMDLKTKSPLQQLLQMHPDKKDWIFGAIRDLASCDVALVQSYNIEETAILIREISEGAGEEPKIRAIPKKIPGLTLEETILTVVPRIGKVRSQNLIKEYGSLGKLITAVRKMSKAEASKRSITKILKEIFG
jgi:ERCC4-type nuclease